MARVLVVDDERSIRVTLRAFLRGAGHDVVIAEDAEEALETLDHGAIDVVVSDIVLPRVTGVMLLQKLHAQQTHLQVIMMTGEPTIETATEALRAGAFDYLSKPVSKEDLLKTVANAARLRAAELDRERLRQENLEYQHNLERLVSERTRKLKEKEDQLRQAQKMEAIGTLAGGVAHDFNNLLTIIGGTTQFLAEEQRLTGSGARDLQEIRDAVRRASDLTRQLLAFSRKQTLMQEKLDLGELIAGTSKMLQRLLGEDVELALEAEQPPYTVTVDPGQIEQVVMNLVVNARDAMPEGGRMAVGLTHTTLDDEQIAMLAGADEAVAGPYALISVTDTGIGMDAETQRQIFDPFFTTKVEGKGTGLGLSTVYGIVKQHGGHIAVESMVGQGTTFRVFIPETTADVLAATADGNIGPPRGTETILCVEDDLSVRRTTARMLGNLGYTILTAGNAEEALSVVADHGSTIHLLLTDVIMPGMNGAQLADCVARTNPNIKVIYASGYPADHLERRGLGEGIMLVRKPFTRDELAECIRDVLDGLEV